MREKTDFVRKLNASGDWSQGTSRQSAAIEHQHLIPWVVSSTKTAITSIPSKFKRLSVYAGIILVVNLIFWTLNPYFLPRLLQPLRGLISTVVFLTATYNDVIPKSIFWVLLFTFFSRLASQTMKRGFKETFACMGKIKPQLIDALNAVGHTAYSLLLFGAGAGLILANNFASYSRFSGARNKIDKYFIVFLIAFFISYMLGEANKTGVFKFVKLGSNDLMGLFGKPNAVSDQAVYLLLSGFVLGMLLDAPLIVVQLMYGGYILGVTAWIAALVLLFVKKSIAPEKGDL